MALPHGTTGSTMPRRQLGRRLRELRNRVRMTTRVAAQRLEWSEAKIWRIETGQTSLRGLDVEAMCKIYGAPAELVEPLVALARETKTRGWWAEYNDVIAEGFEVYIGLEEAAERLSTFENELVPGLLQTEDYTRALLTGSRPEMPEREVDRRLALRAARQDVLTRPQSPLRLVAVLGEALLHHRVGGAAVHAGQLDHLRRMSERPNVDIRVVPLRCPYHEGLSSGRFVLLEFPDAAGVLQEPPVVYVETLTGPTYFDKDHEIGRYRAAFEAIAAESSDALAILDKTPTAL